MFFDSPNIGLRGRVTGSGLTKLMTLSACRLEESFVDDDSWAAVPLGNRCDKSEL